jgi:hypothetical protein
MSERMEYLVNNLFALAKNAPCEDDTVKRDVYIQQLEQVMDHIRSERAERPTPEQVAEQVEHLCNYARRSQLKEFSIRLTTRNSHRTLNQAVMALLVDTLVMQAEAFSTGSYDGRNEASVKWCNRNKEILESGFFPFI